MDILIPDSTPYHNGDSRAEENDCLKNSDSDNADKTEENSAGKILQELIESVEGDVENTASPPESASKIAEECLRDEESSRHAKEPSNDTEESSKDAEETPSKLTNGITDAAEDVNTPNEVEREPESGASEKIEKSLDSDPLADAHASEEVEKRAETHATEEAEKRTGTDAHEEVEKRPESVVSVQTEGSCDIVNDSKDEPVTSKPIVIESENDDSRPGSSRSSYEVSTSTKQALGKYDLSQRVQEVSKSIFIADHEYFTQNITEITPADRKKLAGILGHNITIEKYRIHCTACNKHLGSAALNKDRFIHPLLKVIVCRKCLEFYTSGEFDKDEDGSELYCRWCGQGGKVLCCSKCCYVFCQRCIKTNFGRTKLRQIEDSDEWLCFVCNDWQVEVQRIICAALFEYINKKKETETDQVLLKIDYSQCCQNREPAKKRKREKNDEFVPHKAKSQKRAVQKIEQGPPVWNPQEEEEEVVCAPDLSLLMGEEDSTPESSPLKPLQPQPVPVMMEPPPILEPPPVMAAPVIPTLQPITRPVIGPIVTVPQPNIIAHPGQPIILNALNRPFVTASQQLRAMSNNNATPGFVRLRPAAPPVSTHFVAVSGTAKPQLMSGLKHDWFDNAVKVTSNVHTKLSYNMSLLNRDVNGAKSVEDLAKIHNRLQEVLSNSINSLIAVRKNLRSEFLSGLNSLKFNNTPKVDNDVIFVQSQPPPPPPPVQTPPVGPVQRPYLKVRTVSQLCNIPSECITIPDEETAKIAARISEEKAKETLAEMRTESNDSNKENIETEKEEEKKTEDTEGTAVEIKKALFESHIDKLTSENLKYKFPNLDLKEVKRMMSARVYVKGPKRRNIVKENSQLQDFEELLNSSLVQKPPL